MDSYSVFISRPSQVYPGFCEKWLEDFDSLLEEYSLSPKIVGKNIFALSNPFQHIVEILETCQCTIVIGFQQIVAKNYKIKDKEFEGHIKLPTEWNHIEAAISIMLKKPTLMILQKGVASRGLFEKGAANVFVYEIQPLNRKKSIEEMRPKLQALRDAVKRACR